VDKLYYGKVKVANSWLPDFHWAYDDTAITKYPYDPDKAKALLAEAGWDCKALPCTKKVTEGGKEVTKKLEFRLSTTDRKDRQALASIIQAQLKLLNIGVSMEFLYGRTLFATCPAGGVLNCRTFDAGMYTWLATDDPGVLTLYTCKSIPTKENDYSGQNTPGICDKKLDELLIKGETDVEIAIDRAKRKPIYIEAQKIWTDLVPVIPLKANANVTVWNTHLKGPSGVPTLSGETYNLFAWEWVP
jgi:peptide/nickel transport system substrate-binding protein